MRVEVAVFILSVFEAHIFVVLLNTGWLWGNFKEMFHYTGTNPTATQKWRLLMSNKTKQNPFWHLTTYDQHHAFDNNDPCKITFDVSHLTKEGKDRSPCSEMSFCSGSESLVFGTTFKQTKSNQNANYNKSVMTWKWEHDVHSKYKMLFMINIISSPCWGRQIPAFQRGAWTKTCYNYFNND